jgi:hypothetical protein
MFANYFKTAIRNIINHRGYSIFAVLVALTTFKYFNFLSTLPVEALRYE